MKPESKSPFKKGKPDFIIYFLNDDGAVVYSEKTGNKTWVTTFSELENVLKDGDYTLAVSDNILTSPLSIKEWNKITIKRQIIPWNYLIVAGTLVILLIFYFRVLGRNIKKKKGENELETFRQSRRDALANLYEREIETEINKENISLTPLKEESNIISSSQSVFTSAMKENENNSSNIKIKGLRQSTKKVIQYSQESQFNPFLKDCIFSFNPETHWPDSVIKTIYFNRKSVSSLDQFLINQNLRPLEEKEGMIPEIGGILLGRPALYTGDKKYRVIVENFVPINPEHHTVFKLEFSTQSLVKDLGDIQDQFPDLPDRWMVSYSSGTWIVPLNTGPYHSGKVFW